MRAYVVVNATAVEGRHAALGRPRVIVLDESIVEALGVLLLAVNTRVNRDGCKIYSQEVPHSKWGATQRDWQCILQTEN